MTTVKQILDEKGMEAELARIAREMVSEGTDNVALVGIMTRGVPLAKWLADKVHGVQKGPIEVGSLDINLYRDDLTEVDEQPVVKKTELPFSVNGKGIVLIDDVLYTGRTIRAAMDALVDRGRPKFIKLCVMVDRGWREFPIQADYIGKKVRTAANENVKVRLAETDGVNEVVIKRG